MGVYYRSTCEAGGETLIVLNPGASLQRRFNHLSKIRIIPSYLDLTGTIFSSVMQNWRSYISDIECRCVRMVLCVRQFLETC
jgi:hypothetical protein